MELVAGEELVAGSGIDGIATELELAGAEFVAAFASSAGVGAMADEAFVIFAPFAGVLGVAVSGLTER
jgi:hypothetical protein